MTQFSTRDSLAARRPTGGSGGRMGSPASTTAPDGDTLSIASVGSPSNGTASASGGSITYTPETGWTGTDSFSYTVTDGDDSATATVAVTVNEPLNRAPVAVADAATTLPDTAVTVSVLANDTDPDGDTLSIASVTQPAAGTGAAAVSGEAITYTPPAGWTGTAMFTYTVTDSALSALPFSASPFVNRCSACTSA